MRTRLILASLAAAVALVGCDYTAVQKCDKRGGGLHRCETVWVQSEHHFR